MAGKRRKHTDDFKARVALEAVKAVKTLAELSSAYGIHPTVIAHWKRQLVTGAPGVFASGSGSGKSQEDKQRALSFHRQSSDLVYELERQAYQDGYHLSMGFGGGSCKDYLCHGVICQFLDSGRCRFPHRARPAMEAMGIDVISLINRVGWKAYPMLDDLSEIPCAITVGIVFIC